MFSLCENPTELRPGSPISGPEALLRKYLGPGYARDPTWDAGTSRTRVPDIAKILVFPATVPGFRYTTHMLCISVRGPEIGLPERISAGF